MELDRGLFKCRDEWGDKGYKLPSFDIDKVIKDTKENPVWIHFGAGNIFRAFQANVVQNMLNAGEIDKGLIVAEGFDYEIVEKINRTHDELSVLVTLKADGNVEKTVVGSVVESCILDSYNEREFNRLKGIFSNPSLMMASFTITEKGYSLVDGKGEVLSIIKEDFENGPDKPASYIGKVTTLLYERYKAGELPIAMVSMDNCSHNGDKLCNIVKEYVDKWYKNGFMDKGFVDYVNSKDKVSFPWTMIDKITPRPDSSVERILKEDGINHAEIVVTSKNTYVAPFVNAEECEYLVMEDAFPNGRLPLEKGGILFTDRETVDKVEKMKVCTCLNPLHTALAVFGCLLGYSKISEEMKDEDLRKMVEVIGYKEGLPVVVNPQIINPKKFIDEVVSKRIPNPFMPDTPQRIATDTSQKLSVRYGETIKKYLENHMDMENLKVIPLVFAGWLRYLMAIDDEGNKFELSPDPLLDTLTPRISEFKLGKNENIEERLKPILENADIFGVNLYEAGLAKKVCGYFEELTEGKGAVRRTIKKYV